MRLIIHAGLHKTASTFFQNVILLNLENLRQHGVYAYPDAKLMAHHGSAWMALRGNYAHVQAHIVEARRRGLSTVLLSSEDFEGLIFAATRAAALEAAAREAGAEEIQWHFCLRDPGDYLLAMAAELAKHGIIDFTAMALGALRDGRYRVQREANRLPDAWEFCFDHGTFLTAFAGQLSGQVRLHDFRDRTPFPLHGLYEQLAGAAPASLPGNATRNARLSEAQVATELAKRVQSLVEGTELESRVGELVDKLNAPAELRRALAGEVSRKFAPGMERLLAAGTIGR